MEQQVVESTTNVAPVAPVKEAKAKKAPVEKKATTKAPAKKAAADKPAPAKKEKAAPVKAKAKEAVKKAPAKPKEKGEVKNGVTRPLKGTASGKVWDFADAAAKTKAGVTRKTVLDKATAAGVNAATAATQFARWRVFNGMTGVAK